MEKGRDLLLGALIELRKWVPQVRGPHEQVFVRGVEVRVFGPGKHESQERTVKIQQENGCPSIRKKALSSTIHAIQNLGGA
jgi:hypothetical protein